MKRKITLFFVALCLLLTPVLASADDLLPPEWRGAYNTTYALWDDFENIVAPALFNEAYPLVFADVFESNPAGVFPAYITGYPVYVFEGAAVFATSEIESPCLLIKVNNFDNDNPVKKIVLQMTYAYNRTVEAVSATPGVSEVELLASYELEDRPTWWYSAWEITLYPNPTDEIIRICLGGECNFILDQMVLDTYCVPIPGSALLLLSGVVGIIGYRRFKA